MSSACHNKLIGGLVCVVAILCCAAESQQQRPLSRTELYKKNSPAVVKIELYDEKGMVGWGSGFLVAPDGRIITNFHVVATATKATVRLSDKDSYDVVGVLDVDERKDIALIKIRPLTCLFFHLANPVRFRLAIRSLFWVTPAS